LKNTRCVTGRAATARIAEETASFAAIA